MDFNAGGRGDGRRARSERNNFQSKVAFPLVKERAMIREAIFSQNFRGDPLITVEPAGDTSVDNAHNIQDVLASNFKTTKFRSKAFRIIKKDCAEYGAAVCYTAWRESNKESMKTVNTPLGPQRELKKATKRNAMNYAIHILDYFQDPNVPDPDDSSYQGHIERTSLAKLKAMYKANPDVYIKENIEWAIKEAEKGAMEDKNYHDKYDGKKPNPGSFPIDKTVIYSTCNIRGNEDNENYYYAEIVGGKIIRFQDNPHDEDARMYATFTFYPRREYWWGNSDAEFVLPHEKFTNIVMGMKADQAMRALQSYVFHEKGTIDVADWNNRHKNGGFIGVDAKNNKPLSQLLYQWQPQDYSLQSTDSIMREVKESQQRLTPRPDFTRAATAGGIRNATATAAVILDEQGDVAEAHILENFMFGVKKVAENNIIMLQQRLGDTLAVRPSGTNEQKVMDKSEILGSFGYHVETALNKNKASELMRLQNLLTSIMNFKGSGDPAFQQLDIVPIIKKILKNADIGDVEELMPPPPPQPPVGMGGPMMPGMAPPPNPAMPQGAEAGGVQELEAPQTQGGELNVA